MFKKTIASVLLLTTVFPVGTFAAEEEVDLFNMPLDQLSNLSVTSVSKKSEKASQAPAAIYVITHEDIKHSGMTSIPELLRMVPGIQVAQAGSHQWAITSRGNNSQFANKLLVLMDGRTLYTPLNSGVYWDVQDMVLDDIERIEVIRGPGATLWGANAVNGVINIISKSTKDTKGGLVNAGYGSIEKGFLDARYGGNINDSTAYRIYGKGLKRDEFEKPNGQDANDEWHNTQAGFRLDSAISEKSNLTFQGDIYNGRADFPVTVPSLSSPFSKSFLDEEKMLGGNLLGRWNYAQSEASDMTLQVYYDYTKRDNSILKDERNTYDIDFQHAWKINDRNDFVWGLGYRLISDSISNTLLFQANPDSRSDQILSAFVQDKFAIVPDKLFLTLGSKFENNDYTGFEFQPSGRLSYLVTDRQTVWGSVSRALRNNNRANSDAVLTVAAAPTGIPAFPVGLAGSKGNTNLDSERLIAYEIGYKIQPKDNLSFDVSAFYNDYDDIFANYFGTPYFNTFGGTTYPVVPLEIGNLAYQTSTGYEAAANWEVNNDWKLAASYNYLNFDFTNPTKIGFTVQGRSPRHQFNVRSCLNLPHDVSMDNALYFVDHLSGLNIDSYYRFDTRLAWKVIDGVELSIVGQNLFNGGGHQEFGPFIYNSSAEVGRSVYGKVAWQF
jgi:iron complex outermembrane receptor protein